MKVGLRSYLDYHVSFGSEKAEENRAVLSADLRSNASKMSWSQSYGIAPWSNSMVYFQCLSDTFCSQEDPQSLPLLFFCSVLLTHTLHGASLVAQW